MLENTYIVWEGASLLDGSPIVLIISGLTIPTSNRKTGRLIQSWIIQKDYKPTEAANKGFDEGICGNCSLKKTKTNTCYVNLLPVNSIYKKFVSGRYPKLGDAEIEILKLLPHGGVRLGSYGDPTAVPFHIWEPILRSKKHTGYTHQWKRCDPVWKKYLMASVESQEQAIEAQSQGWRTFRVISSADKPTQNEILCPHNNNQFIQCETCLLCDGFSKKPNIADKVHGLNWKVSNFEKFANK